METLHEIITIHNDADTGRDNLKILIVDDLTRSKLVHIRANLYKHHDRLRAMPAIPQPQQPQIDPERKAYLDAAYARYMAGQAPVTASPAMTPQPIKPLTFDEQLEYDWRYSPGIRKEFTSFGSYQAYCRAVRDGRAKIYGRG